MPARPTTENQLIKSAHLGDLLLFALGPAAESVDLFLLVLREPGQAVPGGYRLVEMGLACTKPSRKHGA